MKIVVEFDGNSLKRESIGVPGVDIACSTSFISGS